MEFNKGDRVRSSPAGVVMEVVASSGRLALCAWTQDGERQQALFELTSLQPASVAVQQQQQPQQAQQPQSGGQPPDEEIPT